MALQGRLYLPCRTGTVFNLRQKGCEKWTPLLLPKICSQGRHVSRLIIGEQGELASDGEQVDQPDDHFDSHLSRLETLDLLEASKQNYQGVARLGIEALALKVQGMRITDIAALYQVPPSHVGAWISRSLEKLRNDPDFLTCLL